MDRPRNAITFAAGEKRVPRGSVRPARIEKKFLQVSFIRDDFYVGVALHCGSRIVSPLWRSRDVPTPKAARTRGIGIVRVFVLGGTGSIGAPMVRELIKRGHDVCSLARSDASAASLVKFGATPIGGDIVSPAPWVASLPQLDAVIHAACDFSSQMSAIDRRLLDVLLPALATQPSKPRFIYTGGCWLFGATGDDIATEETPFCPLPAFAWMVPHLRRILEAPEIDGIVIHPAMVYEPGGGVFHRFARDAGECAAIGVVESEAVRWPLVHSEDLASLYALALERAPARSSYIGAAIEGFAVGRIARAFAKRFRTRHREPQIISAHLCRCDRGRVRRLGQRLCARSATQRRQGAARARLEAETSGPGR
jgi:nucleoside-diphosphate-sugar epimerase